MGGLTAQGDGEAQEWCQPGVRRCWGGADTWLPRPRPQGPPGPFDGQQAGAAPRRLALLGGGQVDPGCPSACPACLQALNGWEPFVGEQLAAGPLCGAVGKSAGSLSHPLQSPDYLGASRTPSQGCPPQQGWGWGPPRGPVYQALAPESLSKEGPLKAEPRGRPAPCPPPAQLPDSELPPCREGPSRSPHPPHPSSSSRPLAFMGVVTGEFAQD